MPDDLRTGRWPAAPLPPRVRALLEEPDPDWDYATAAGHIVVRTYDDGREIERIAARIVETRPTP